MAFFLLAGHLVKERPTVPPSRPLHLFPRRASEARAWLSLGKPWSQENLQSSVVVQLRALLSAPKALFHGLFFLWVSQHLPPVAPPDGRSRSTHTSEVRPVQPLKGVQAEWTRLPAVYPGQPQAQEA